MTNINISNNAPGKTGSKADTLIKVPCNGSSHLITQPDIVNDPGTPAQLKQRERFALIVGLLKRIKPFLRAGFAGSRLKGNGNAVNRALSYNICNAIRETDSGQFIDYSRLRVSEGVLPGIKKPHIELSPSHSLTIHWLDNSGPKGARPDNRFMCMAWCPELEESVELIDGPVREQKYHILPLPRSFTDHAIHIYGAFRKEDGSTASNSVYLGEVHGYVWKK